MRSYTTLSHWRNQGERQSGHEPYYFIILESELVIILQMCFFFRYTQFRVQRVKLGISCIEISNIKFVLIGTIREIIF